MFVCHAQDTILPREDLPENRENMPEIGQRIRLSRGDIAQTMALYKCPGRKQIKYLTNYCVLRKLFKEAFQSFVYVSIPEF